LALTAATSFTVNEEPQATATPTPSATGSMTEQYFLPSVLAIIIVVIIVGAATVLLTRRR
jgi:hypothetical protein